VAKIAANVTRVWVDEFALSGFINATSFKVKPETPEVTAFADAGPRRVPAGYDHEASHGALLDLVDGAIDDLVWNALNTDEDHYLLQAFAGSTAALPGYEQIVRLSDQARNAKSGAAQMIDFSALGSGGVSRASIMQNAAITGTGNQTGQNLGATVANTILQVVYRVLAVSGTGSITFAIQESSDDGSGDAYAAISGLGATFTAIGVQRFTTVAATEAWKRLSTTAFSTFTSVTALVTVGTVAGT
jgi:hypothetical protein